MRVLSAGFMICLFLINQVLSEDKSLQFEDFFSVSRLGKPVVSPDGSQMAFTVKKANIDDNSYSTQIWIINSDGTDLRQLTTNPASNTSPEFSADGKYLYLLNKQSGSMQVSRLDLGTSQIDQVTDLYGDINGFCVSPQNTHILLGRKVPPDCPNEASIEERGEIEKSKVVKARIIDQLMYRHWNEWLEGKFSHLFISSIGGKDPKDLTPGMYHTPPIGLSSDHDYTFSPDGKEVCYVSNHDPQVAISTNNDLFITNLEGNKSEKISISTGNDNQPHYSPDGKYIAYSSMERTGFEADRQRIMLYDRSKKSATELTKGFELSVTEILWAPNSTEIYFTVEEKGNISIYKVDVLEKTIVPVLKGNDLKGIKFLGKNTLVFLKQSTQMPYEIFSYQIEKKDLKQLTHFNDARLAEFDLPPYEEFWFIGANGDSIQGFIMKPPLFEEGKKYPTVHMIHGGPQGMWSNEWHFRWNYQMFAAPGYAVYYINFHGSRGYGQKFTDSISRHWGDLPYEDLVKGTEYVIKNFDFVDGERLAAAGASYGGFMINWIAGHDNPYRCLISHDGTYEQVSMWGATEELWFPEWEFGGTPWEEGTVYEEWSPSRLAANFKTPTLVIHGEHDYRVPYTQGLQFFSALQRQGVPSRLLFFPDEDHFVQKPQNAQFWWNTVYEWLNTYLLP